MWRPVFVIVLCCIFFMTGLAVKESPNSGKQIYRDRKHVQNNHDPFDKGLYSTITKPKANSRKLRLKNWLNKAIKPHGSSSLDILLNRYKIRDVKADDVVIDNTFDKRKLYKRDTLLTEISVEDRSVQNSNLSSQFLLNTNHRTIVNTQQPYQTPVHREALQLNPVMQDPDITEHPSNSGTTRTTTNLVPLDSLLQHENAGEHVDLGEPSREIPDQRTSPECDLNLDENSHENLCESNEERHAEALPSNNEPDRIDDGQNTQVLDEEKPVVDIPIVDDDELTEPGLNHGRREIHDIEPGFQTERSLTNPATTPLVYAGIGDGSAQSHGDTVVEAHERQDNEEPESGSEVEVGRNASNTDNEHEGDENGETDHIETEGGDNLIEGGGEINYEERGESESIRSEKDGGKSGVIKGLPDDGHETDGENPANHGRNVSTVQSNTETYSVTYNTDNEIEPTGTVTTSPLIVGSSYLSSDLEASSSFDYYMDYHESDYFETDMSLFSISMYSMDSSFLSSFSMDSTLLEDSFSIFPTSPSVFYSEKDLMSTEHPSEYLHSTFPENFEGLSSSLSYVTSQMTSMEIENIVVDSSYPIMTSLPHISEIVNGITLTEQTSVSSSETISSTESSSSIPSTSSSVVSMSSSSIQSSFSHEPEFQLSTASETSIIGDTSFSGHNYSMMSSSISSSSPTIISTSTAVHVSTSSAINAITPGSTSSSTASSSTGTMTTKRKSTTNSSSSSTTFIPFFTTKRAETVKETDKATNVSASSTTSHVTIRQNISTTSRPTVHRQTTQKTDSLKPPLVYIQIMLRMTWMDFCSCKHSFLQELQTIVIDAKKVHVHDNQFKIQNLPEELCSDVGSILLGEDRMSEITIEMYLVDRDGKLNITLTIDVSTVILKGFQDSTTSMFKDKIVTVKFQDHRPRHPVQTETEVKREKKHMPSGVTMVIVIAAVGGVCCVALVILQVLLHRRVKAKKQRFYVSQRASLQGLDHVALGVIPKYRPGSGYSNQALDTSHDMIEPGLSHIMTFSTLANFCMDNAAIYTEFQTIPCESPPLNSVPVGDEDKNRFANVLPYKNSRVKLIITDGRSDYINANYVTGYMGEKYTYIATQSPMVNTVEDFWRMVWEQQSRAVLMLNPAGPNGKPKQSTCYWPDNVRTDTRREFGDYVVTLKKRDVQQDYVDCTLDVMDIEKNLKREIHHFLLTCWTDSGTPEPLSFVKFVLDTRPHFENSRKPVVIHCGPGTGRTGTLIAVDTCMRMFEDTRRVDILSCVHKLRSERAGAVQTKEQYNLIYQAINEYAVILSSPSISTRSSVITLHAML